MHTDVEPAPANLQEGMLFNLTESTEELRRAFPTPSMKDLARAAGVDLKYGPLTEHPKLDGKNSTHPNRRETPKIITYWRLRH
jgi:hypothetical protein